MRAIIFILIGLVVLSCRNSGEGTEQQEEPSISQPETSENTEEFTSEKWRFSAEIPESFEVFEGELPGKAPIVNFYDSSIEKEPPFGIHNDASMAYIAVLPEGYGVDGPGGPRKSLLDWDGNLPLSFNVNRRDSYVYLMENGEPWGISLRFHTPPPGWNEYGGIYVFYQVNNFRAECFSSNTGEKIAMEQCNPLGGDAMKFYGEVSEEKKKALNAILESLYFTDPNREREEIGDLIKVEKPQENATVSSPLEIKGEAKGYWFFEATAPIKLISESGKELAESYVEAQGEWMTENWVPFAGRLEFKTNEKRGYLIVSRANASGKPEHDRMLRVPVEFN
ncbi:Gmad2 immunoglobulin-like domain-containing protein [Salinimicrobium terrae]|uniref:Gmad2 immunoglobulin-like domain-containing protein n=1 Tax=Salinimicrobium terrae TaxID=470866 RepID=UPI0004189BD1|nr:Gmad2 immunoglobulin-like domain-containing protein [Salinimicrobium terrae]